MIKYQILYKDYDNVQWHINIETANYEGSIIAIRGVQGKAGVLSYAITDTDDPFSPYSQSTLSMSCYNEGQIDIRELQQGQDKDFIVTQYRETILKWKGYLKTEGVTRTLLSAPYTIELSAICGLAMLDDIPYNHIPLAGVTSTESRIPINYIRSILFYNLGIILPIRWTNNLQCTAFTGQDVFAGSVQWATDGQGYVSYQSTTDGDVAQPQTCGYILEGFLRSMQCRIYQAKGQWVIRRIPDISNAQANVIFKAIAGNGGILDVQTGNENLHKQIGRGGDYKFLLEDALITATPGLKSCTVTYTANVRDNILPNGSQDNQVGGINAKPVDWGFYGGLDATYGINQPLTGRSGASTLLTHTGPGSEGFTLIIPGGSQGGDGLDIDTQTVVQLINFGFIFEPISGFAVDGNGVILWDSTPLNLQVIFNTGPTKYYLNQFGFWQTLLTTISITVDNLRLGDVAKVDFDKFQGIIMPTPASPPVAGDISNITVIFFVHDDQQYAVDNIYINSTVSNDVYSSTLDTSKNTLTDKREINISTAFGGYFLSNFMNGWYTSAAECYYRDGAVYEGTLTGLTANAIMRYRYKSSEIFNGSLNVRGKEWSFDELYYIDGFGASIFLPLNGSYNTETGQVNGLVAIECRNDDIELTEKYYGSNDNTLSN